MGQYWYAVNLDKREFANPHKLGTGLKLWEQLANHPGTGAALIILCAAMPEPRGGGDLDLDANWHGPERTFPENNLSPGPMPEEYPAIAKRTIGRWAGDRVALVGDYAVDTDLASEFEASKIYDNCNDQMETIVNDDPKDGWATDDGRYSHSVKTGPPLWTDVSEDVAQVIEHELKGSYSGDGWRHWNEGVS